MSTDFEISYYFLVNQVKQIRPQACSVDANNNELMNRYLWRMATDCCQQLWSRSVRGAQAPGPGRPSNDSATLLPRLRPHHPYSETILT